MLQDKKYNTNDLFAVVCKNQNPEHNQIAICHLSPDNTVLSMYEITGTKSYAISREPVSTEEAMKIVVDYYTQKTNSEVSITNVPTVINRYAKLTIFDFLFANGKYASSRKLLSEKPKYTNLTSDKLPKLVIELTEEMRKNEPKFTDDEPTL